MVKSYIPYVDELRDEFTTIKNDGGEIDSEFLYFPDLIQLLCDLLDQEVVDKNSRILINAALGYLLVTNDVVPEDVYGTYGYMDDMYVTCRVIQLLKKDYSDLISTVWTGDESFDKVIDQCTFKSEKFLEAKNIKNKILKYCGFDEE